MSLYGGVRLPGPFFIGARIRGGRLLLLGMVVMIALDYWAWILALIGAFALLLSVAALCSLIKDKRNRPQPLEPPVGRPVHGPLCPHPTPFGTHCGHSDCRNYHRRYKPRVSEHSGKAARS